MRKYLVPVAILALSAAQFSFADETVTPTSEATPATETSTPATATNGEDATFKQCETIAQACMKAGFTRGGGKGKAFWRDCMRPIIAGKTVTGITADPTDVKACRQFKVEKLQKKLDELKAAN